MNYTWDSSDLRKDLKELEKRLEQENDPIIREQIYGYIIETKIIIIEEELIQEKPTETDYLSEIYRTSPLFIMYYPIIETFISRIKGIEDQIDIFKLLKNPDENKKFLLTPKDSIELIHEFFRTTPKEIFDIHNRIYRRKKHIRFDNCKIPETKGEMIFIPGVNKPYITISTDQNDSGLLISMSHEEGHAVASLINPNRYQRDEHSFYSEIESLFFELIADDYFENELDSETFKNEKLIELLDFLETATMIIEQKNIADIGFKQKNPTAAAIKIDKSILSCDTSTDSGVCIIEDYMKYAISYIVAIELYELYKEDKEQAVEKLKNILNRGESDSEYQNIMTTVTPNKSLVKFRNRLITKP